MTPFSTEQHALGSLHFAGKSLGTINSNTGIPIFSEQGQRWISSRTGETAPLDRIGTLSRSWHSSTPMSMISTQTVELPDRHLVERYVELYQRSFASHVFPVVDPIRFRGTIATAYAHISQTAIPSTYQELSAQACIYAFLALSSIFNYGDDVPVIGAPDDYASKAQWMLTVCCLDVSIETLQLASMLVINHSSMFYSNTQADLHRPCSNSFPAIFTMRFSKRPAARG